MAAKSILHDLDLMSVGQIINFRIHNVTTSVRTTLAGSLNSNHKGLQVWDTDLEQGFAWTGTAWKAVGAAVSNPMTYQGGHSSLTTTPSSPAQGHAYVMTSAGTLTWAGQTFSPSAVVELGDMVVYRGSNVWDIYQANAQAASETVAGLIELATQAETNAGADDQRAVTPAKLAGFVAARGFARTYFNNSLTLVANTPLTVTHNLGLQNKDSFTVSVKDSAGSEIGIDIDSVDINSLTLTSSVALSGVKICVTGF